MVTKSLVAHLAREDFLARMTRRDNVPHIPEAVFAMLDQKSLTTARLVSHAWRTFVDENSPLWGRINTDQTQEVAKAGRVDIMSKVLSRNPSADITPAYILAVERGDVELVKIFLSSLENKNPINEGADCSEDGMLKYSLFLENRTLHFLSAKKDRL